MRSNGLTASAYTPVADLDPRVADALLGELKDQGVAAYTKPVESTSASGFDRPEFRSHVLDRLYVDASESERVKALISDQDPDLVTGSDDLTWAQIVAGFDQPPRGDVHPWPVTEDLDSPTTNEPAADGPDEAPRDRVSDLKGWLSRRDATGSPYDDNADDTGDESSGSMRTRDGRPDEPDDEVERFVPDPPPPLPQLEPWQQLAWVGVLGGPLLLLIAVLFSISLPTWASLLAVAGFIGGFITLVARMDGGDSDDDTGNGAVV
jgi:hypothetical protein